MCVDLSPGRYRWPEFCWQSSHRALLMDACRGVEEYTHRNGVQAGAAEFAGGDYKC